MALKNWWNKQHWETSDLSYKPEDSMEKIKASTREDVHRATRYYQNWLYRYSIGFTLTLVLVIQTRDKENLFVALPLLVVCGALSISLWVKMARFVPPMFRQNVAKTIRETLHVFFDLERTRVFYDTWMKLLFFLAAFWLAYQKNNHSNEVVNPYFNNPWILSGIFALLTAFWFYARYRSRNIKPNRYKKPIQRLQNTLKELEEV